MTGSDQEIGEADLVAYADGRLDPPKEVAMAAWLGDHPDAQRRVDLWRAEADLLRAALDPVAFEPIPAAVAAMLTSRRKAWLPMAAAAAGIFVGFVGAFLWLNLDAEPVSPQLAEVGLSAHQVYIQEGRHAVEVTVEEEAHLVAWLSNRLDANLTPPDLSDNGLTLLGGRVVPIEGDPAALLMYEDASGARFTLLVARSTEPETISLRYAESTGAGAFYWIDGAIGYVFSGPDDRDRLERLTQVAYDQLR